MSLVLSTVLFKYLSCPTGIIHDFVKELADEAEVLDDNYAVERYHRTELDMKANDFLQRQKGTPQQATELRSWIASLPWDDGGKVSLHFDR